MKSLLYLHSYSNSPFLGSWKVTKLLHENEAKVVLAQLKKWEIINIIKKFISMLIISTAVTVPGKPSLSFHVEAWLPYRPYA